MSQSPSHPRRGRFRFFYQFSLRTLLLGTAAVAVFCNWYFQPKYREEELAGKELKLRRQVKTGRIVAKSAPLVPEELVNHGNWSLLDGDDLTLTRGRFHENVETGQWTAWFPTGGKAAEGKMQQGVKVGRWRTWREDGSLASDIYFSDRPVPRDEIERKPTWSDDPFLAPYRPVVSSRDGPAKAWHENGKLKYEGQFTNNQQDGLWSYYDQHGRITESGPYRRGNRHGKWTIYRLSQDGKSHREQVISYVDGRTERELNEILVRLKSQLASKSSRERYAALIDLAELGEGGAPVLLERLAQGDARQQAAIIGMLPRMPTGRELLLPRVRELMASGDESIAHQCRLTLFQLDPAIRDSLFDRLLGEAIAAPALGLCLEELTILYRNAESRRGEVFATLMELSILRDDSDEHEVANAVADLGGNVTPYLLAAFEHHDSLVRLQAITALQCFHPFFKDLRSQVLIDDWQGLISRLKTDPSEAVRRLAEGIDSGVWGPSNGLGQGSGFTGSGF